MFYPPVLERALICERGTKIENIRIQTFQDVRKALGQRLTGSRSEAPRINRRMSLVAPANRIIFRFSPATPDVRS